MKGTSAEGEAQDDRATHRHLVTAASAKRVWVGHHEGSFRGKGHRCDIVSHFGLHVEQLQLLRLDLCFHQHLRR